MLKGAGTAVISASELRRITDSLEVEEVSQDHLRAKALQAKSQARVDTWTNTLAGSRRKKQQMRLERLEREELERQKIDEQEAAIQLELRKAVINKANHQVFNEADRIKTFQSQMMYSDVIAEREAQMELKDELAKLELIREEKYKEMDRANYQKALDREIREKNEKDERQRVQNKAQQQQREFKLKRADDEKARNEQEGMLIRMKARDDLEMEKKLEENRKKLEKQTFMSSLKIVEYNKQLKEAERIRFEKEEEKIKDYAERKQLALEKRKAREAKLKKDRLDQQQKLIDKQARLLGELQNKDEERVANQVADKEAKDLAKLQAKEAYKARMEEEERVSRKEQIDKKRLDRMKDIDEQLEIAAHWQEQCKRMAQEDEEDQEMRFQERKELQRDHIKMAELKRRKAKEQKRIDDKITAQAKASMEQEALDFHHYAEGIIREYAEDGKNIIPIVRNLKEYHTKSEIGQV